MNEWKSPTQTLSPSQALRVDEVCDRFESDWREGRQPAIEDYISDLDDTERAAALRELLRLEITLRRAVGQSPQRAEYDSRFPTLASELEHNFAGSGSITADGNTPSNSDSTLAIASHAPGASPADLPTARRFRVVRPHARGGLGAVFLAVDEELDREVALKQMLGHVADDPSSRRRFVTEARITGNLEHPGIVPVYGLGLDEDGRPFYAMRFVRGDSLKEAILRFHADESLKVDLGRRSLELRKLLRRFLDVCNAVDYAHGRGVIHRDLKPANIILGKHGETLVVDWGLAKATNRPDIEPGDHPTMPLSASGSSETLPGSALGTPSYMSPEQARGEIESLGPTSDVFSLGATLYCILTGRPPYDGSNLADLMTRSRECQFPAPRTILPSIDPPLEAVCLKAMAATPKGRYTSARALADDVERWLADEPVEAWPEPILRRAARWARRHRTPVVASGVLLVVTAAALAAGNLLLRDANLRIQNERDQARIARAEAERQRSLALTNLKEAETQRKRAEAALTSSEQNYFLARNAVSEYLTKVSDEKLLSEPHMERLRRDLLGTAREYYQKFTELRKGDSAASFDLANAQIRLGEILWKLGDHKGAIDQLKSARNGLEGIQLVSPENSEVPRKLVSLLRDLSNKLRFLGSKESVDTIEASIRVAQQLVLQNPSDISFLLQLGESRTVQGIIAMRDRQFDKAREILDLAGQDLEECRKAQPQSRSVLQACAENYRGKGILAYYQEKNEECLAAYEADMAIIRELASRPDATIVDREAVASAASNLASAYSRLGRLDEAESVFKLAVEQLRKLMEDHPGITNFASTRALALSNLGTLYERRRDFVKAEQVNSEAIAIQERLIASYPNRTDIIMALGAALGNRGNTFLGRREYARAIDAFNRSIAHLEPLLTSDSDQAFIRNTLRNNYWGRADSLSALGKPEDAAAAFDRAVEMADERNRSEIRLMKALMFANHNTVARALEIVDSVTSASPTRGTWFDAARVLARASTVIAADPKLEPTERSAQAETLATRAIDALRRSSAAGYLRQPAGRRRLMTEPELAPLRNRPDFAELRMDAELPVKVFTK